MAGKVIREGNASNIEPPQQNQHDPFATGPQHIPQAPFPFPTIPVTLPWAPGRTGLSPR
jgi:hypothetical protein